jgi:hypothetical protein
LPAIWTLEGESRNQSRESYEQTGDLPTLEALNRHDASTEREPARAVLELAGRAQLVVQRQDRATA